MYVRNECKETRGDSVCNGGNDDQVSPSVQCTGAVRLTSAVGVVVVVVVTKVFLG